MMGIRTWGLLCLFLQISCALAPEKSIAVLGESQLQPPAASPTPLPITSPSPASGYITFKPTDYYSTVAERKKIKDAEVLMNKIVQSQCFYEAIDRRALIQTDGRTSHEVAKHLQGLRGDLPVEMYYRCMRRGLRCLAPTTAVAYRQPPAATVHLNQAYFYTGLDTLEWASTLGHEGLGHSLGNYDHDFKWTSQRVLSVPYSINYAIEKCGKEIK
jgi:hypothetical protein